MQPYKKLFTFWFSVIIYDRTVEFCNLWIRSWKLKEQMEGAARSAKQNIVEGSDNLTTSLKVCIKLTGISKSSLEELIGDLEDFLRQRKMNQWMKNDSRVLELRSRSAKIIKKLKRPEEFGIVKSASSSPDPGRRRKFSSHSLSPSNLSSQPAN